MDRASGGKFWQAAVRGSTFHVTFGKIGTKGQSAKPKVFPNADKAIAFLVKKEKEKRKKGYVDAIPPAEDDSSSGDEF